MITKERPSVGVLPVTLSFGDLTIMPDESIMGSTSGAFRTSMGRNTKLNHTSKKKLHSLNSPSLRLKGGSGLADVRVTFKNLQTSVVDNGI